VFTTWKLASYKDDLRGFLFESWVDRTFFALIFHPLAPNGHSEMLSIASLLS